MEQIKLVTVVGLLGGVASGKSSVAKRLRELGAEIVDGDALGHEVLAESDVIEQLVARWGAAILDEDRRIVRREVAKRVFGNEAELSFLEGVMHSRIGQAIQNQIEVVHRKAQENGQHQVLILDAAVMLKAGWDVFCDRILFVDASFETRKARAMERGWTAEHFATREADQVSPEEKRNRSDIVIDNDGCLEQTYEQVLKAWNSFSQ